MKKYKEFIENLEEGLIDLQNNFINKQIRTFNYIEIYTNLELILKLLFVYPKIFQNEVLLVVKIKELNKILESYPNLPKMPFNYRKYLLNTNIINDSTIHKLHKIIEEMELSNKSNALNAYIHKFINNLYDYQNEINVIKDEIKYNNKIKSSSLEKKTYEEELNYSNDEIEKNRDIVEKELKNKRKNENIIINRCIEFPPHLKQAGLGILTYFGTIIEQKYPEHNSKVSIEQDRNLVRLVIETESGEKEIIEKVLEEYTLVVTNQKAPEDFLDDKLKIIELKNELNIANTRLECSHMMINHKDNTIKDLNNILINMSKKEHNITINNNNYLESKNEFTINFPEIISNFKDFVLESQKFPELQMEILDLNELLENLENKKDPEKIKDSTALKKLNEFLNSSIEKGTKIDEFINTVENGCEKVKNIGKKYNSVAKWCGAPIIPFFE